MYSIGYMLVHRIVHALDKSTLEPRYEYEEHTPYGTVHKADLVPGMWLVCGLDKTRDYRFFDFACENICFSGFMILS